MIKANTVKLLQLINRCFNDHKKDNATSTVVAGKFGNTQIQIIATNENAFLIDDSDVPSEQICLYEEDDLENFIRNVKQLIDDSESLSLDNAGDRKVLVDKFRDKLPEMLNQQNK